MPINCVEGDVLEVFINEGKIVERCLVPHESLPSRMMETSVGNLELPDLQLDGSIFMGPYYSRYCIVTDVEPRMPHTKVYRPNITIVLITSFYGEPLDKFIASDKLCRVLGLGSKNKCTDSLPLVDGVDRTNPGICPVYPDRGLSV